MHTPGKYHTQWRVPHWVGKVASITFLLFGIGVLVLSVWQQMEHEVEQSIIEDRAVPIGPTPIVFTLPGRRTTTEGILPDHPLYVLKMTGDRMRLWTIKDPLELTRTNQAYADERLAAAVMLVQKGKLDLAVETIWKAEGYLKAAQEQLAGCEQTDEVMREWQRLLARAEEHRMVLRSTKEVLPESLRGSVERALEQQAMVEMHAREKCGGS